MIEAAIVSLINAGDAKGIIGGRVYPVLAPDDVQKRGDTFVVYERISRAPAHTTRGPSGLAWGRVEVRVWAKTFADAKRASDLIRDGQSSAGLDGFSGVVSIVVEGVARSVDVNSILSADERNLADTELKLFGVSTDYLAWYHER